MYMDWGSMYIVVAIHVLCYHVGLSNGSCIGECVEFDVFVRLECVDNLVDRIIVSGNLESFYMLVRTCR